MPGREEGLLGAVSALAPAEAPVEKLEPAALETFRHFPVLAIESMSANHRLLHTALRVEPVSAHRHHVWSRMSFFPRVFTTISRSTRSPRRNSARRASRASGGVESIEIRDGDVYRRRLRSDEIARLAGDRGISPSTEAGNIARRIYRLFDPRGIMLP